MVFRPARAPAPRADALSGAAPDARYSLQAMGNDLEDRPARPPIVRRAVAGVVVVAAAALALHLVIGLVTAVFWFVVVIAAVAAVLWALKTLVW